MDASAGALFGHEFLPGLEEVHGQAHEVVDASELGIGPPRGDAIIADEMANDGAVLLLDVGAVILLPGAAPSEREAFARAVALERLVDERRAVIAIEAAQGHGPAAADFVDGGGDPMLAFAPEGLQLDPTGGDVDGAQGEEEDPLRPGAAVGDQIDLAEARGRVGPRGERANRDLLLEPGARPGGGGPAPGIASPRRGQQAGEGGPAGLAH